MRLRSAAGLAFSNVLSEVKAGKCISRSVLVEVLVICIAGKGLC